MTEINQAIQRALSNDEDILLDQLGERLIAIDIEPSLAGSYDPILPFAQPENIRETAQELGRRVFRRLYRELYQLLCGQNQDDTDDRQKITNALGLDEVTLGSALASILIGSFGVAPAIATIAAVIIVKRVFSPTFEEVCQLWSEQLT